MYLTSGKILSYNLALVTCKLVGLTLPGLQVIVIIHACSTSVTYTYKLYINIGSFIFCFLITSEKKPCEW